MQKNISFPGYKLLDWNEQAGAELCQAQAQLGKHAETTTNHNLH